MATSLDPRDVIDQGGMSPLQIMVVAIMVLLCALDGFDLLSISFAAPGIADEWGINRVELGLVLSMEFIGMGIGAVAMGAAADRFGRRPAMLACLVLMTAGMLMAAGSNSVPTLSVWRVLTGLGIGGMLSSVNAMAAEFSNTRTRHLSCSVAVVGVPLGGATGGMIAAMLLQNHDWRAVFYFGSFATACCLPLVYFCVPESVHWLAQRQPANALAKINKALASMRHAQISVLPAMQKHVSDNRPLRELFVPGMRIITLSVTTVFFLHVLTFYFMMKWLPKIVVDMGFTAASAAGVLVWVNIGGVLGGTLFGLLSYRVGLRGLLSLVLLLSALFIALFGQAPADLAVLSILCGTAGFFTMAAMSGLYAFMAHVFPTHVRGIGTGFGIGVGRGGSVIAPIIAGVLFNAGMGLPMVATLMAMGSFFAILVLFVVPRGSAEA